MVSRAKPRGVQLIGENSFIRLHTGQGGPMTTRVSHWRILYSPGGPGHALFIKSDVTDDQVRVYADNIMAARWLQAEIESMLSPEFADQNIPVVDAVFSKSGDGKSFWTELVESDEDTLAVTWYDLIEPIMIRSEPGSRPGRDHGVFTCLIPAKRAQVTLNGEVAQGMPLPEKRGNDTGSTACLAWAETWILP